MAQTFHENFRQRGADDKAYSEGWDRVFGKKNTKQLCNFCHIDTYTQDGDCVDCGFSKPNKEQNESQNTPT